LIPRWKEAAADSSRARNHWLLGQRSTRRSLVLFVVTADANAAMTRMLTPVLREVRELLGPRRSTPPLSLTAAAGVPNCFENCWPWALTFWPIVRGAPATSPKKRFTRHNAKLDGRPVEYLLHDQSAW